MQSEREHGTGSFNKYSNNLSPAHKYFRKTLVFSLWGNQPKIELHLFGCLSQVKMKCHTGKFELNLIFSYILYTVPIFPNHTIERNPHYVILFYFFQFPNHTIERKSHYVNFSEFFQKPHYSEDHTMWIRTMRGLAVMRSN